jgi:ribonucleoside-diphosphate reductase alpha chain
VWWGESPAYISGEDMSKHIVKKNGSVEPFSIEKIDFAISKALGEVPESINWNKFDAILKEIDLATSPGDDVETIQDLVEKTLMAYGLRQTAKAYMNYRDEMKEVENKGWEMSQLQKDIYEQKYRHEGESFTGFLDRISVSNQIIRKLIKHKKILPAGRILANRGLHLEGRKVTLSNCYVMERPEDNLESIFDTAKKLARTYSYGGGCGVSLNKLRPNGSKVNNNAKTTTGVTSFSDLYSTTTGVIGGKGRRGALMLSLSIKHPDVEEFIDMKTDLNRVTKANISIEFDKAFFKAAENKESYLTRFVVEDTGEVIEKEIDAYKLLMKFSKNNSDYAEPGALYWDEIEAWNLLSEDDEFEFEGVNPCAEEPLPKGGSCLLTSINLAQFVFRSFQHDAEFDFESFKKVVAEGVIYLNEVLDEGLPLHPLAEQRESVRDWRQIGLGVFGIADMLIKLGIKYGSDESLKLSHEISNIMINQALVTSAMLAKEFGTYPKYKADKVLASSFFKTVANFETKRIVREYGLRNSQLLTIAPTGSLSTMWGVSGGIEPMFNIAYTRITKSLHDGVETEYTIFSPIAKEYMDKFGLTKKEQLPDYFVTANEIPWIDRIKMQATWQNNIDASISSTINLPNSTSVEEIAEIYIAANNYKLKGITIYRDGCKRSGILVNDGVTSKDVTKMGVKQIKELLDKKILESVLNDPNKCPMCGGELKHSNGCHECLECGYSPCSL